MTKYVVQPERSPRIGHGHWLHSHALGIAKSPGADYQRNAMREVVMVAPRVPVAQAIAAAAEKAGAK